jgi:hypothetical protein
MKENIILSDNGIFLCLIKSVGGAGGGGSVRPGVRPLGSLLIPTFKCQFQVNYVPKYLLQKEYDTSVANFGASCTPFA